MDLKNILNKHEIDFNHELIQRALTTVSYKQVIQRKEKRVLKDYDVNITLSTYGDVILKYILTDLLFAINSESITITKSEFEEDKFLVNYVARNINLLEYVKKDETDKNIPLNYDYAKVKNNNSYKYLATTVEALIGAVHIINNKDFSKTRMFVEDLYISSPAVKLFNL